MTAIECLPVCVYISLCISTCHVVHLNRCICLLTVGAYWALFLQPLGGALAVELRLCVNQAALQTASRAPHCVGSCSSLVSCCHSKFFSSLPLSLLKSLNHHHHLFSDKHFLLKISFLSGISAAQFGGGRGCDVLNIQLLGIFLASKIKIHWPETWWKCVAWAKEVPITLWSSSHSRCR